jgi:hypothetical protein
MPRLRKPRHEHPTDPGAIIPIKTISLAPAGSTPSTILYLLVDYIENTDGSLTGQYTYDSISGTYPLGSGIGDFIEAVQNDDIDRSNRIDPVPSGGPPVVECPSYIVFAVDSSGDASFDTSKFVQTDDSTANEYFNVIPVYSVPGNSSSNCYIVYFRCISPSARGQLGNADGFNLYFNNGIIDPDIQNTGHPHTLTGGV